MSLSSFFDVRSVAVVGASSDPLRIGGRPVAVLKRAWLPGDPQRRLLPINPTRDEVQGLKAYPTASSAGPDIDLAIIAVPAAGALAALEDCADAGCKAVIMFTSGFGEAGEDGKRMQAEIAERACSRGVRLLGPNCLGLADFQSGLFATFSDSAGFEGHRAGSVGVASQSGAVMSQMIMLARRRGLGLSKTISTGNEADVDVADAIDFLVRDPETRCILAYCETARRGAKLIQAFDAARKAGKPLIMLKSGRTAAGQSAALSHTGSMAGEDRVFDAIFRQHGVWRAATFEEAMDIAYVCTRARAPSGKRLAAVTISGGAGIMLADEAVERGIDLAPLGGEASKELGALLPYAAVANPLDTTAQAVNDLGVWSRSVEVLLGANYDAVLMYLAYFGESERMFPRLAEAMAALPRADRTPIVFCSLFRQDYARQADELGFLVFEDPARAVAALAAWMHIHEWLRLPRETTALAAERKIAPASMSEFEARRLLADAGIAGPREALVRSAEEAELAAAAMGYPVVMKINSPDIAHKTEVGGVVLGLRDGESARAAFDRIMSSVATHRPDAKLDGVIVARQLSGGAEFILGSIEDPLFGSVIMVGAGGVMTEVTKDVSLRLAPLGRADAEAMIAELKASVLLDGFRGGPQLDGDGLVNAIVDFSDLVVSLRGRATVEVNPLLVTPEGCFALDAVIMPVGQATH